MITPTRAIEHQLTSGYLQIAGIDEVGRGCLAGPVVAAAVILGVNTDIPLLRDSKKLNRKQRDKTVIEIKQQSWSIGIGWVSAEEVDERGLSWAVKESGLRALQDMNKQPDFVILDGNQNYLSDTVYTSAAHIGADATESCVAAASIIAKCARDNYMELAAKAHPGYGFESHVGYGTVKHKTAIAELGITPLHRQSFAGVLQ
jgi:ribonuclease HII